MRGHVDREKERKLREKNTVKNTHIPIHKRGPCCLAVVAAICKLFLSVTAAAYCGRTCFVRFRSAIFTSLRETHIPIKRKSKNKRKWRRTFLYRTYRCRASRVAFVVSDREMCLFLLSSSRVPPRIPSPPPPPSDISQSIETRSSPPFLTLMSLTSLPVSCHKVNYRRRFISNE